MSEPTIKLTDAEIEFGLNEVRCYLGDKIDEDDPFAEVMETVIEAIRCSLDYDDDEYWEKFCAVPYALGTHEFWSNKLKEHRKNVEGETK